MRILGIETSCDETASSVVENGTKILSNIIASSSEIHTKTGGIIPENAARQQVLSIIPVIKQALFEAFGRKTPNTYNLSPITYPIDAIAVTYGPGLIGSLLVGVETAKTLSCLWKRPLIPVNHLVGHIYANWLLENNEQKTMNRKPDFPALALVVSGGHTDLVLMKNHGKIKWIGGTRDDAAGEAFDKTARLLRLPYPGGPAISASAEKFKIPNNDFQMSMFPRPMIDRDNYDWSFSGLKTAVLNNIMNASLSKKEIPRYSAEVQEAIVDILVNKTIKAVKKYKPKSLLLAGGVAANSRLREKFQLEIRNSKLDIDFFIPPPKLCTDNAAYIASCAYFNNKPVLWSKLSANPQLSIMSEE
jgi:N6-L-threonylcarbamoyladenine synthase